MSKKYRVIYADPPWDFSGKVGGSGSNVKEHYKTLSISQIKNLNVKDICKKNSICFMWCCEANLKDAIEILGNWGFKYKTIAFVWIKTQNRKFVTVPAPWTSKCTELCLLGTKGDMSKYIHKRPHELIISERQEHSKKPEEARKRIEEMFPKSSKIELFARQKSAGWDVFGNEVESDVLLNV